MTATQRAAIDHAAASCGARYPRDLAMQALLIRAARTPEELHYTLDALLESRASWLDYVTRTQRRWMRETRRPSRARHHDSISIRESYVRVVVAR